MAKKYKGWWCPWCATWVDDKDLEVIGGDNLHEECGYSVEKRMSDSPIVPEPPTPEVKAAHARYHQMVSDFVNAAM